MFTKLTTCTRLGQRIKGFSLLAHDFDLRECKILGTVADRLAAYEDTGLTPKQIEAQGDKIIQLSMEIAELRESTQALKAYAENIEADKDAQGEKLKLMETVLKNARTALELLHHMNPEEFCFVFEVRCAIDALLGG